MSFKTEVRNVTQSAPIALVATKIDLRGQFRNSITSQELERKKQEHNFVWLAETSSKNSQDHNVRTAWTETLKYAYYQKYPDSMQP